MDIVFLEPHIEKSNALGDLYPAAWDYSLSLALMNYCHSLTLITIRAYGQVDLNIKLFFALLMKQADK